MKTLIKFLLLILITSTLQAMPSCTKSLKTQDFVQRFYAVILGREADNAGMDVWTNQLLDRSATGATIAKGFIFSAEYNIDSKSNTQYLNDLYAAFFNRPADTGGFNYWMSKLNGGMSRADVLDGFLHSAEFINLSNSYGIQAYEGAAFESTEITNFVQRFYSVILGRTADSGGLAHWTNKLSTGESTGADIAKGFILSNEYNMTSKTNEDYLNDLYHAFFNREADSTGFNTWLDKLNRSATTVAQTNSTNNTNNTNNTTTQTSTPSNPPPITIHIAGGSGATSLPNGFRAKTQTTTSKKDVLDGFLHSQEFINLTNTYGILAFRGAPKNESNNTAPVVNAGSDQNALLGETLNLSGSASSDSDGTLSCYWWKEGSTLLATTENFSKSDFSAGTHTLTLTVVDDGGVSASDSVGVTVDADTMKPLITLIGNAEVNITVGDNYTDAGATVSDDVDGNITDKIVTISDLNTSKAGTYHIRYNVSDSAGNKADEVSRTVNVIEVAQPDTTKPLITLIGNAEVNITVGDNYTDAGATAFDDIDGNITDKITITSNVNTTKEGSYTIKYDVSDLAGNHANSVIRHIKIVPKFKYIGPGNGGAMYGIAVDPFDSSHIITGGDMSAAFSTEDNGTSWNIIGGESGKQPGYDGTWEVKADPNNRGTFWLAGGGVFKSTDGAKTWKSMSVRTGSYGAIGIVPNNPENVYVAQGYVAKGILSYSHGTVDYTTDGGLTWTNLLRPGGEEKKDTYHRTYSSLVVDDTYVYLSGRGGIWRHDRSNDDTNPSSDGWTNIGANITGFNDKQGSEILLVKDKLVATVSPVTGQDAAGVYISSDNGDSWEQKNGTADGNLSALIQVTKNRNKHIDQQYISPFVLAHSKSNPDRIYLGSYDALAKSDDMGETWKMLTPIGDYDTYSNYFYDLANNGSDSVSVVTGVNGFEHAIRGYMDSMHRMTVDPNDADIVYFSDNQDLYRSTDAGVTWNSITFDYVNQFVDFDMISNKSESAITAQNRYEWSTKSRGIQDIVAESVAVAPDNSDILYIAYMDLGLEISRDNGKTWEHPTLRSQDTKVSRKNFLPPTKHTWALATDKDNPKDIYVSRYDGYLYKSSDYGKSWKRIFNIDRFWDVGKISSIVIDTNTPKDKRTIYITTLLKGLYKSTDGGDNWERINDDLPKDEKVDKNGKIKEYYGAYIIKIDPNDHKTLYVGTKYGLFKTIDAGSHWQNILDDGASLEVNDISIAQTNPTVVYAKINKADSTGDWALSGVWQLKDNHWTQINPTKDSERGLSNHILPYIGGIAVNPYDSNYVYTCARQVEDSKSNQAKALLRSKDGGETWENIIGETPYAKCTKITIDPTNPQRVFVNMTFGVLEYFDADAPTKK